MSIYRSSTIRTGLFVGFVFAVVVVCVALLNHGQLAVLQWATNFCAALPVYLARKAAAPELLSYVIFFVYWSSLGGAFGWLMRGPLRFGKSIGVLLAAALVGVHALAQRQMEQDIVNSIEALFSGFVP